MSEQPEAAEAKAALRRQVLTRRGKVHGEVGAAHARALAAHADELLDKFSPSVVSGYHPFRDEIDCLGLLERLAGAGSQILLPAIIGPGHIEFRLWRQGDRLIAGQWGIREPAATSKVLDPDMLLIPLVAFDRSGFRLGYGGGYYDRALERLRQKRDVVAVGIAFDEQMVDSIPREPHDQPLDRVLTPSGSMVFHGFS